MRARPENWNRPPEGDASGSERLRAEAGLWSGADRNRPDSGFRAACKAPIAVDPTPAVRDAAPIAVDAFPTAPATAPMAVANEPDVSAPYPMAEPWLLGRRESSDGGGAVTGASADNWRCSAKQYWPHCPSCSRPTPARTKE
jgi:hypothetical protein